MERNDGKFGMGLILGILAGVAAGFLLAPQTGEETRKKIMDSAEDFKDQMNQLSDKIRNETNEWVEKGKLFIDRKQGEVKEYADKIKDRASEWKEKADYHADSIKENLEENL